MLRQSLYSVYAYYEWRTAKHRIRRADSIRELYVFESFTIINLFRVEVYMLQRIILSICFYREEFLCAVVS